MEIDEEKWILIDWREFKLLNTSKQIEVWIDIVKIMWTPLKCIRIENWWELDIKTLKTIIEKIKEKDFQIFIERPHIDEYDNIIIQNGEIL
jgi:hypothetical protein